MKSQGNGFMCAVTAIAFTGYLAAAIVFTVYGLAALAAVTAFFSGFFLMWLGILLAPEGR